VSTGYLNPPTGLCYNVLLTATRRGDPGLATQIMQHLAKRRIKLTLLDYETLIACYVKAGDIKAALSILCIMKRIDLEPGTKSTRSLHRYFNTFSETTNRTTRIDGAFSKLRELKSEGRDIPIAALNVVIENADAQNAMELYKSIPFLCNSPPNVHTFNHLFRLLRVGAPDRAALMFLVSEMKAMGVQPDMLTYDRILLVCARHGFWKDAGLFWKDMKHLRLWPRDNSVRVVLGVAERVGEEDKGREAKEFVGVVKGMMEGGNAIGVNGIGRPEAGEDKMPMEMGEFDTLNRYAPEDAAEKDDHHGAARRLKLSREEREVLRADIKEILRQVAGDKAEKKAEDDIPDGDIESIMIVEGEAGEGEEREDAVR
jgi:pentatricopeptide repeat protein